MKKVKKLSTCAPLINPRCLSVLCIRVRERTRFQKTARVRREGQIAKNVLATREIPDADAFPMPSRLALTVPPDVQTPWVTLALLICRARARQINSARVTQGVWTSGGTVSASREGIGKASASGISRVARTFLAICPSRRTRAVFWNRVLSRTRMQSTLRHRGFINGAHVDSFFTFFTRPC